MGHGRPAATRAGLGEERWTKCTQIKLQDPHEPGLGAFSDTNKGQDIRQRERPAGSLQSTLASDEEYTASVGPRRLSVLLFIALV